MILTISYHKEEIVRKSYEQLKKTTADNPMPVLVLDNHYPLIKDKNFVKNICEELGFLYFSAGQNIGLHNGYNYLRKFVTTKRFILYDGDSFPTTDDWNTALTDVVRDPRTVWASLYNHHSYSELDNRGYWTKEINGYKCRVTQQAVTNSVCAFQTEWVESVGGFSEPNEFYGGFEVSMWKKMNPHMEQWAFLNDYKEDRIHLENDSIYTEYKWKHAHLGMRMSFEQYVGETDLHGNMDKIK
jgi:hypothetical protein